MTCIQCGEMLFSALERTRGVCATCYLSYRSESKRQVSGRHAAPPSDQSRPDEEPIAAAGERESERPGEGTP